MALTKNKTSNSFGWIKLDSTNVEDIAEGFAAMFNTTIYQGRLYFTLPYKGYADDINTLYNTTMPIPFKPNDCIYYPINRELLKHIARSVGGVWSSSKTSFSNLEESIDSFTMQRPKDQTFHLVLVGQNSSLYLLESNKPLSPYKQQQYFSPYFLGSKQIHYIDPKNRDTAVQQDILNTIKDWLGGSEEQTAQLLSCLSTALLPDTSLGKQVIIKGSSMNGKSILLSMLRRIFSIHVTGVTRQDISEKSQTITELNTSLINIVSDGSATVIKDSSREKQLVSNEPVFIRKLYEVEGTAVQTNTLFIEALNEEPKTYDKSAAINNRILRFVFPNTYVEDREFQKKMLSDKYCSHLLSILVDTVTAPDYSIEEATEFSPEQMVLSVQQYIDNSIVLSALDDSPQILKQLKDILDKPSTVVKSDKNIQPILDEIYSHLVLTMPSNAVPTKTVVTREFKQLFNADRTQVRTPEGRQHVYYVKGAANKYVQAAIDYMSE